MLGPDFISDHITVSAGPVIANVCGSACTPFSLLLIIIIIITLLID